MNPSSSSSSASKATSPVPRKKTSGRSPPSSSTHQRRSPTSSSSAYPRRRQIITYSLAPPADPTAVGSTTRLEKNSLTIGIFIPNPASATSNSLPWAIYRTTATQTHMYVTPTGYRGAFPGLYAQTPPSSAVCFYKILTYNPTLYTDDYQHQVLSASCSKSQGLVEVLEALADENLIQLFGLSQTMAEFVQNLETYAGKTLAVLRQLPPTSWVALWPNPTSPTEAAMFNYSHV